MERPNVGDRVRIARGSANQFSLRAIDREGIIVRVRNDGLAVVRWTGVLSEQVFSTRHLERIID